MTQLPFNFYDVFGFLMPGLVLVGLVAAPWVDLGDTAFGAALLTIVVAYGVGFLLHEIARPWVRSDSGGRLPSDAVLDEGELDAPTRSVYEARVRERFELDVAAPGPARDQAFLLARTALVAAGRARYAEQFQGKQALCRGLVGASVLGAAWLGGLAVGVLPTWLALVLVVGAAFAVARAAGWLDRLFDADGTLIALPLAAVALAGAGAVVSPVDAVGEAVLALLAAGVAAGVARVARGAHDRYARAFVEEVVRGFVVLGPDGPGR